MYIDNLFVNTSAHRQLELSNRSGRVRIRVKFKRVENTSTWTYSFIKLVAKL